jgi:uncharacterized protein YjbI with pentapeptide repeats
MKTIKPRKLGVLCKTFENDGAFYFSVAVLVFFPFSPPALLPEVDLWKLAAELGDEPLDIGMPKERGEVLVTGAAYPPGAPRPVCTARVAIGTVDKTLRVTGDRFWKDGIASDPQPFAEMPLRYERAFGGEGYPQNPLGKGASPVQAGEEQVHALPNVEHPNHLVRSPDDRPPPAGFGAYDLAWPQRSSKAGTHDDAWRKERFPGFPADMDWSIWNAAPDDQQIEGYFQGDEAFTVEHMHPDEPVLEGRLPGVRARAFVTRKTDAGETFREIATRLDTVRLFPRAQRGIAIFHGMLEVAEDDAADVAHLVVGCEELGELKPAEHYREVLARRLDRKTGYLLALRDGDLLPARPALAGGPADDPAERAVFVTEGLLQKNVRRKLELEHERAAMRLRAQGIDPAQAGFPPLPPEEPAPDGDDPSVVVERAMAEIDKAKEDAEGKQAEAERAFRALCAAQGIDPEKARADAQSKAGGPPKFSAAEELEKVRATSRKAKARGIATPEIDAALADGRLEERLRAVEQQARQAYLKFAHYFPAAARLEGEPRARVREEVAAGCRAGRSFAGCDLTGADLSGLDLAKADFRGAFLERADLSGAQLRRADLTGAVLARADLSRANLFAASLAGANLGSARLADAEVGGADLSGAVLVGADLSGARFADAQMARADLSEAKAAGADFTRARAPEATFLRTDLAGAKWIGADATKANFLEATMKGADFTGAKLVSAVFLAVEGDRAAFREAELGNARVVRESSFEGADFRGAQLRGANLRGTKLRGSDFRGALLSGADLSECDLRGASFRRAVAKEAKFVRADLTGASLRSVDLLGGSLAKAVLHGTSLRRANLFRVDFARARTDEATDLTDANVKRVRIVPPRRGPHAP